MSIKIHPTAIIGPEVQLSPGVEIGEYCVIRNCFIGENTKVYSHTVIGTDAEHRDYFGNPSGFVFIEDNCVIREFVTINKGTTGNTHIKHHSILLRGSHVGHDAVLEEYVTLSCNVIVGGHAYIMKHANLGLGSVVHQRCLVPSYSMIGMNGVVTKSSKTEVAQVYVGVPVKPIRPNTVAITRHELDPIKINDEQNRVIKCLEKLKQL